MGRAPRYFNRACGGHHRNGGPAVVGGASWLGFAASGLVFGCRLRTERSERTKRWENREKTGENRGKPGENRGQTGCSRKNCCLNAAAVEDTCVSRRRVVGAGRSFPGAGGDASRKVERAGRTEAVAPHSPGTGGHPGNSSRYVLPL
jgi:hypothetical protein